MCLVRTFIYLTKRCCFLFFCCTRSVSFKCYLWFVCF